MHTKAVYKPALIGCLILLMAMPYEAFGQGSAPTGRFRQEELDQMLAPVALYPDSLLAQILVASTYPLEVVEADRWVQKNKNLEGNQLNTALDKTSWDLSVKALVPFPQVLAMMSEQLDWTQTLGDAFLSQQTAVMDTVQKLRAKAKNAGNLQSSSEQVVTVKEQAIVIEPASPTVVYVPAYNPAVVYGAWPYPAYPPYSYYPYGAAVAAGAFGFAAGVAVGAAWNNGWGSWNWGGHTINANINRNVNINSANFSRTNIQTGNWQHDATHRKGVAYRDQATRQQFSQRGAVGTSASRSDYRGFSQGGQGQAAAGRVGAGGASQRPATGAGGVSQRPGAGAGTRPAAGTRPTSASTMQGLQQRQSGGAFAGAGGSGSQARMQANRGQASRQASSGSFRGAGAGGGRTNMGGAGRSGAGGGARAGGGGAARAGGGARGGGGGGGGGRRR